MTGEATVTVEQCDRDVAAAIVRKGNPGVGDGNKVIGNEIKGKLHDDYAIVQAFARHRLTETTKLKARIAELEGALRPFAAYRGSDGYLKSADDDGLCAAASFTAGDYRRARTALETGNAG